MVARRFALTIAFLILAAQPWVLPSSATHAPVPPASCHPRGCSEWLTTELPAASEDFVSSIPDLARDRLYALARDGHAALFLIAFDASDGELLWRVPWSAASGLAMIPNAAAVSPDGTRIVVTGRVNTPTTETNVGPDLFVSAFEASSGALAWAITLDEAGRNDEGYAIAVDGSRAYVLGSSRRAGDACNVGGGASPRVHAAAFDLATGALSWSVRDTAWLPPGAVAGASAVVPGRDGAIHFAQAAQSACAGGHETTLLWTVDAASGATRWTRAFTAPGALDDWMKAIVPSTDQSRLFVGGWGKPSAAPSTTVGTLGAFDAASGSTLWSALVPTAGDGAIVYAIAVNPDATRLLVASDEHPGPGSPRSTRIQMRDASDGAIQWAGVEHERWGGGPTAAAFSPDGSRAYVAGAGGSTTYTASLAPANGAVVWTYVVPLVAGQYHHPPFGIYPTSDGLHVLSVARTRDEPSGRMGVVARSAAVVAPPERPAATAAPGDAAGVIRVAWTPPADDGGRPITSYVVSRSASFGGPYAQVGEVNGAARAFDDAGNPKGIVRWYVVAAVNALGAGPPSNVVSAAALGVPDAPVDVRAIPGPSLLSPSVVVSWQAPANNGGSAVTAYKIVRHEASGDVTIVGVVGPSVRSFEDTEVRLVAAYTYGVTAWNRFGEGPAGVSQCTRASPVGTVTTRVGQPCLLAEELEAVEPSLPV